MSQDQRRVAALIWKKLTPTDAQSILGGAPKGASGGGARHIALHRDLPVGDFVGGAARTGGSAAEPEYTIDVQSPDGQSRQLGIVFDTRGTSERKEWRIRQQSSSDARPSAWEPGKKLPATEAGIPGHYIILVRLEDGSFHARIATDEEVGRMPSQLRDLIRAKDQGVSFLDK